MKIEKDVILFILEGERVVYYIPATIHHITSVSKFKRIYECHHDGLVEYCTNNKSTDDDNPFTIQIENHTYTITTKKLDDSKRVIECIPVPIITNESSDSIHKCITPINNVGRFGCLHTFKCFCKKIVPPLHAMFSVIHVMSYMDYDDNNEECFTSMINSLHEYSTDIIRIITNVNIYMTIIDGKFKLALDDFNVRGCIEETRGFITKIDESKSHVNIIFHIETLPIDELHTGDRVRVLHILNNLLTNSMNHTKTGEIVVTTRMVRSESEDTDVIIVTVSDDGVGIPFDRIGYIYEPFHTPGDGVGLGLFITKYIVELMGGCISIDSTENEGTVVTIKLPIKKVRYT